MSRTPERDQIFREGERRQLARAERWLELERAQHAIAAEMRDENRTMAVALGGLTPSGYVHPDVGVFALVGMMTRADHMDRLRMIETLYTQIKQRESA
jgi:hypothetical protein